MSGVLGIDPGITGGWAILTADGELVDAGDIPAAGEGTKRMVSGALFKHQVLAAHNPARAVIEQMTARQGENPHSSLRFGQGGGILRGVVEGNDVPIDDVPPANWKKHFGLIGKDKDDSRLLALRRWPAKSHLFARKKDHGRAEAALIALHSIEKRRPAPAGV